MAPFDVLFNDINVVIPDVLFVSTARLASIEHNGVHGAPDLVIEVLSPGTRRRDLTRKRSLYEDRGVNEYWLVDAHARTVTVLRRAGTQFAEGSAFCADTGDVLTTPLLTGFSLSLQQLFR